MGRTPQRPQQTVAINAGQSIQDAINGAPAGSTFQFGSGVWREQEFLARSGDQFIGDPGGGTILSGARVLDQWQRDGQVWRCRGLPAPLTDSKPVFEGSLANQRNDLWIDNTLQTRVGSLGEVRAGTWFFDPAGNQAVIGADPQDHTVEYDVVANQTWDNGATGCLWRNITVEKYATEAQNGAHHGMRGWTYDNATFQQMHGAGVNIGADTVIAGGYYNDNGQSGINGYRSNNARIENAEIARNGYIGYNTDWDGGGVKICSADGVVFSGNHVFRNKDQGLWLDIDCTNCVYEGNTCEDNTGCGIMYEISYGETRIQNNHCARNGGIGGYGAGGIYISNSMGVDVSNNTIEVKVGNSAIGGGIAVLNQDRGAGAQGTYKARSVNVHHNTITHSSDTALDGYWVYKDIANPAIAFDHNTYIVADPNARHWRWYDKDLTWDEFKAAGMEPNGTVQRLGEGGGGGEQPPPGGGNGGGNGGTDTPLAPGTYYIQSGTTLIVV